MSEETLEISLTVVKKVPWVQIYESNFALSCFATLGFQRCLSSNISVNATTLTVL